MRLPVGYSAEAKKEIPVRISFRCPYCRGENRNIPQRIRIKGEAIGTLFSDRSQLLQESGEKLQQEESDLSRKIETKDYEQLHLQTVCSFCKKPEPWSSYCDKEKYNIWGIRAACASFIMSIAGIGLAGSTDDPKYLIIPLLMIIATVLIFCYPATKKRRLDKELAALPEECKPVISLYSK